MVDIIFNKQQRQQNTQKRDVRQKKQEQKHCYHLRIEIKQGGTYYKQTVHFVILLVPIRNGIRRQKEYCRGH